MKFIACLLCLGLSVACLHAQTKEELWKKLNTTKSDTAKVNTLHALAQQYWGKDADTVALLTTQALELAQKAKYKRGLAQAYSDMGNLELQQGNYKKAISYHEDALKIEEKIKDKQSVALTYSSLGSVYGAQGKHKDAVEYFKKALAIEEDLKQTENQHKNLNKLGEVYARQSNYDKALEYYGKSLKVGEEAKNPIATATSYNSIGEIYRSQKDLPKALEYYEKAKNIFEEQKNKQGLAEVYQNMARAHSKNKEYDKAEQIALMSLELSKEIGSQEGIKTNSETLAEIYQIQQKPEKALDFYKNFARYKDSINNAEAAHKLEQQQFIYLMNQKKQELDMMRKDQELQTFESEKRKNELQIAQKEAEAQKLLALARAEEDQSRADSLRSLAEKAQLEANLLKTKEAKFEADHELRLQKQKEKDDFFWDMIWAFAAVLIGISIFAFYMYHGRLKAIADKKLIDVERKRAEELLLNILPLEIAQELKARGSAPPPRLYESASVMFTDYSGFTEATERNPMTVVVQDLNECFVGFDRITAKYDIEKIKTIGDAFMCAKGIPTPCKAHAVDMVLAGLEMQRFMIDRKRQKDAVGEFCFQCRLGINSGEVIAGVVGERKFCYDIWGNTVNTANRMELSGKVERVNISSDTMELVKDFFVFETRDPIQVKGKGIMQLYFVLRIKPELSSDADGIYTNESFKKLYKEKFGEVYNLPV